MTFAGDELLQQCEPLAPNEVGLGPQNQPEIASSRACLGELSFLRSLRPHRSRAPRLATATAVALQRNRFRVGRVRQPAKAPILRL